MIVSLLLVGIFFAHYMLRSESTVKVGPDDMDGPGIIEGVLFFNLCPVNVCIKL